MGLDSRGAQDPGQMQEGMEHTGVGCSLSPTHGDTLEGS